MNKLNIYSKSKTLLINELLKLKNFEFKDEKKISQNNLDVYFHSGIINEVASTYILNAKTVIANSKSAKREIIEKTHVVSEKVHVIYPAIRKPTLNAKDAKKQLCEELKISKKERIIFFTARTLKTNGVKELFNIVMALNNDNFKIIIASDPEQINTLKFQIAKYKLEDKVIFYENFKEMDLLYAACDIFVLPTYVKNFSLSILKAMSLKSAVFVSATNSAKEIVDVFSTMESPEDPNTSFKIDALLREKADLKLIKKQNAKAAKEFYILKQKLRVLSILNIT